MDRGADLRRWHTAMRNKATRTHRASRLRAGRRAAQHLQQIERLRDTSVSGLLEPSNRYSVIGRHTAAIEKHPAQAQKGFGVTLVRRAAVECQSASIVAVDPLAILIFGSKLHDVCRPWFRPGRGAAEAAGAGAILRVRLTSKRDQ